MSEITISKIEEQISSHEQELVRLKLELEAAKLESPDHQLAKELHGMLCTWNHTDGCGWYYEFKDKQDDWNGHAHGQYLTRARMLIHKCEQEGTTVEKALAMYKLIKGI
jgi:hypothetical protein